MVILCVDLLCLVFWLAGALSGISCVSWDTLCWGCPSGMAGPELGLSQDSPRAPHAERTLEGQLKLTWVQTRVL